MNVFEQLQQQRTALSKAEARVAAAVLDDPAAVVNMTTAALARKASVSDPMVSRFCRSLGCGSFPAFKVQLAQALATGSGAAGPSFVSAAIDADDDVATVIDKRVAASQAGLQTLRQQLDPAAIEDAVALLAKARQILVIGAGAGASIAQDAQHKLFRLGIPTVAHSDALMQRMAATALSDADCVLAISFTGRTGSTVDSARIARDNGAAVIALTAVDSPLAELAQVVMPAGGELEDTTLYVPMTARIVALTLIDIIATALALQRGGDTAAQLLAIKQSLEATKI